MDCPGSGEALRFQGLTSRVETEEWARPDLDTFITKAERVNLNGVVEQITCPLLITHGTNDRQIYVDYAHQSYEQAVNAAKRVLRLFTPEEGATEHCGLDHLPHVAVYTADWIEDTLRELDAAITSPP